MSITPYRDTPLKRALLHMLKHGGLKRSGSNQTWTGKTSTGYVHFKDVTIIAAGEVGLVKLSANKRHRAKQFVSLTPKGMQAAQGLAAMVRARAVITEKLDAPRQRKVFA